MPISREKLKNRRKLYQEAEHVDPVMMADWNMPPFLNKMELQSVAVWAGRIQGDRPKESPTHYDPVDNLFLQLRGTKVFGMYGANHAVAISPKVRALVRAPCLSGWPVALTGVGVGWPVHAACLCRESRPARQHRPDRE